MRKLSFILLGIAAGSFLLMLTFGPLLGEGAVILVIPLFLLVLLPICFAALVSIVALFCQKPRKASSYGAVVASLLPLALFVYSACPSLQVRFLKAAAKAGLPSAQLELGGEYLRGSGYVEGNVEKGIYWMTRAAESGHLQAQLELGEYYLGRNRDPEKARFWLERVANSKSNGWEKHSAVNQLPLLRDGGPSK